jgi:hypothetical protein
LPNQYPPLNDDEELAAFAQVFDRPAFYTPIHQESNMGDFKQAITDTIQALGAGIWKARDGHVIDRIRSRHQLKSATLRAKLPWERLSPADVFLFRTIQSPFCRTLLVLSSFAFFHRDLYRL